MSSDIKTKNIKVLLVNYHFTDKKINGLSLGKYIKEYYENNSRGKLNIILSQYNMIINTKYNKNHAGTVFKNNKNRAPKGHDYYLHFCNPKVSRANGKHAVTWASRINTVHEFGHLLGLTHANTHNINKPKQLVRSSDPFDQMTSFASYASTNAPHRFLMDWYLPGEFLEFDGTGRYNLWMLKSFGNKKDIKTLFHRVPAENGVFKRFFVSLVDQKNQLRVAVHTIYGPNSSILLMNQVVQPDREYYNKQSGLRFRFTDIKKDNVLIEFIGDSKTNDTEKEDDTLKDNIDVEDEVNEECTCNCSCNLGLASNYNEDEEF